MDNHINYEKVCRCHYTVNKFKSFTHQINYERKQLKEYNGEKGHFKLDMKMQPRRMTRCAQRLPVWCQ